MDIVITSTMQISGLLQSSKSSDFATRKAENEKFRKDARSAGATQNSATKRFIPLAMNHFGLRGGHFNVALKEFASLLVLRPNGCLLMKGPFALSMNGALRKILETWGTRLTWTVQRQHATQIISDMEAFFSSAFFFSSYKLDAPNAELGPDPLALVHQQRHGMINVGQSYPPGLNSDWHQNLILRKEGRSLISYPIDPDILKSRDGGMGGVNSFPD